MATDFKLPDLGEGVTGGDVVQVLVAPGDTISAEQTVIELETDKAVLEVPSSVGGKVVTVHVKPGQHVNVGATLITLESNGTASASAPAKTAAAASASVKATAPATDAADKKPAKPAPAPQRKAPDAGSKAPAAQEAPAAAKSGGASPSLVQTPMPPLGDPAAGSPTQPTAAGESAREPLLAAGPATRRLARELGVDIEAVAAAYPGQRITEELLKAFVREGHPAGGMAAALGGHAFGPPPLPDFKQWGEIERVPFTSLQRKTAEALLVSWTLAPQVTQFDVADISSLETLRRRYRDAEPSKDVKLTVMAFVLKALTVALKAYPQFNASLDAQSNELVLKRYYHIGVAVDTEAGLIVPVLRDVDRKNVLTIAAELVELAERTRKRKVTLEELRGGTFTVTNLGGIGGTAFTPIVNYPDVAILGLGRTREEPFVKDGQIKTRLALPLCLSYDHRVINGADGARFIRKISGLLEDPELLLLGAELLKSRGLQPARNSP